MTVGLFPGQGVAPSLVLDSLTKDDLLVKADELLGYDLRARVEVSCRGKSSVLPTAIAQPAIFVGGLIAWTRAVAHGGSFNAFAGHSVGEFAALVAGGSISFDDGLCAVASRAAFMERAARMNPGGMMAVLGPDVATLEVVAEQAGVTIANDNAPGQVVLAGSEAGLARSAAIVREMGARAILLDVSGPFHSDAMEPAVDGLRDTLDHISVRSPRVPVMSNVTARPYRAPGEIRKRLVEQLVHRVRFREVLEWLWQHKAETFEDFGPGDVVARLARRSFKSFASPEKATIDA